MISDIGELVSNLWVGTDCHDWHTQGHPHFEEQIWRWRTKLVIAAYVQYIIIIIWLFCFLRSVKQIIKKYGLCCIKSDSHAVYRSTGQTVLLHSTAPSITKYQSNYRISGTVFHHIKWVTPRKISPVIFSGRPTGITHYEIIVPQL
jgi:hypothetical protein